MRGLFTLIFCAALSAPHLGTAYPFGTLPASANIADLNTAYNLWKTRRLVTGGCANSLRVDNGSGNTFSEGMGYGMLMAAYLDPDDVNLGKLYNFYSGNFDSQGLMNWSVPGGNCSNNNANAATDGDIDVVLALIQAHKRWPANGWNTRATALLNKMYTYMVDSCQTLKNGDVWGGCTQGGNQAYNPSYFRTGYMKSFDCFEGGTRWGVVRTNSYAKLNTSYTTYALTPDWLQNNGNYGQGSYYYDACRTPWSLGLDYLWFGNASALNWDVKFTDVFRVKAGGTPAAAAADIGDNYDYMSGNKTSSNHQNEFIGAIGVAAMGSAYPAFLDAVYIELRNKDNNTYFADSLKVLYMMTLNGVFTEPACATGPTNTFTRSPTRSPTPSLTATRTATRTNTPLVPTATFTVTLTRTPTLTATRTSTPFVPTATFTATLTRTPTLTATRTNTPLVPTATFTPSSTPTLTATRTMSQSPTITRTATSSVTSTLSSTRTFTPSSSATQSQSPSWTPSPLSTATITATRTATPSLSPSFTATRSATPTFSATLTRTASPTASSSFTASPIASATNSPTVTMTSTVTSTLTATLTRTSTPTPSRTATPSNTPSVTVTPSATRTSTVTPSVTLSPSHTVTAVGTFTYTPVLSATSTRTPSSTVTPSSTGTPSISPSLTQTPTFSPTATRTSSATPSTTVSPSSSASPSKTPTPLGTLTDSPTRTASPSPTPTQSFSFTASPSRTPSPPFSPSVSPTPTRTASPAPPSVSSLSLSQGGLSGGDSITINGLSFVNGAVATLNGAPLTGLIWIDPNTLQGLSPAGTAGFATLVVTNPDSQQFSLPNAFEYKAATPTSTPTTATVATPQPDGPPEIEEHKPLPNPNPGAICFKLKGSADDVELRLYTKSMACFEIIRKGACGAGWQRFDLDGSSIQEASNGLYFYTVVAFKGGAKQGKARVGNIILAR